MSDQPELFQPPEEQPEEQPASEGRRAWLTPVIAVLMLVVGLLLGYTGRPIVQPLLAGKANATQLAEAAEATQQAGLPSVNPAPASGEPTPTLMEFLITNTQHFKGDAGAPVTMIEFSDYQ